MAKTAELTEKVVYRTYEDYPIEDLLTYAGIDCIVTSELCSTLMKEGVKRPVYTFVDGNKRIKRNIPSIKEYYDEYLSPAFDLMIDMEIAGMSYNVEENTRTHNRMMEEMLRLESNVRKVLGNSINLESDDELVAAIYGAKGYEVTRFTKSGSPSMDFDALKDLAKRTGEDWLLDLAKYGDIASTWRTFIRTYVKDFVKDDGRIYPSYNLHGTSSGRISGENPNLTQLPRPKHGFNVRACYDVKPGHCFITLDFSSAEVKILGAISQDPMLLQAIKEGRDFHSYTASKIHNISYEDFVAVLESEDHPDKKKYKELRQGAKAVTFGILYGSTANGIASGLGVSVDEANKLIAMYFDLYPGIKKYIEDTHEMARINHYVVNPFGLRKMEFGTMDMFKGTAVYNASLRNAQNV